MSYFKKELALLEAHLQFSQVAAVSLYAHKDVEEPFLTSGTLCLCNLPEGAVPVFFADSDFRRSVD